MGRWLNRSVVFAAILVVGAGTLVMMQRSAAEQAFVIPPPAIDAPGDASRTSEVAILAGGCFWGVQGVFQHVEGVTRAVSGYAGGAKEDADYWTVGRGRSGHAEAVEITFDPRKISYGQILQIYFSVAHDPTQLDRQGPDTGPQYRSEIFATRPQQADIAKAYIAQLDQAKAYRSAIVTKIGQGKAFYPAEDEHQDFMSRHPTHGYIVINDMPKLENLKRLFANVYREKPVLVMAAR